MEISPEVFLRRVRNESDTDTVIAVHAIDVLQFLRFSGERTTELFGCTKTAVILHCGGKAVPEAIRA